MKFVKLLMFGGLLAGGARAGLVAVSSPGALGANDTVVWAQFGPSGTILPVSNDFTSTGGLTGTIADQSTSGTTVPQLRSASLYNLPDNPVFDDQYDDMGVAIAFNSPVEGAGVLIMNDFGSTQVFDYHITVFGAGATDLGTFDFASPQVANTPSFIGVLDTSFEITKVLITSDAFSGNSGDYFALDTLQLVDDAGAPGPSQAPEPSSVLLAAPALLLLLARRLGR